MYNSSITTDREVIPQEVTISPDAMTIPKRAILIGERVINGIVTYWNIMFQDGTTEWVYPSWVKFN